MKILILSDGYSPASEEAPIEGRTYYLEDAETYTAPMRKLWEALIDEWFKTGLYDYDTISIHRFREHIKMDFGEGFDRLMYADEIDGRVQMVEVKSTDEIPEHVMLDFADGNRGRVQGVVKSTTRYTKKQFSRLIDNTINAMQDRGIDSPKFRDIIETISEYR